MYSVFDPPLTQEQLKEINIRVATKLMGWVRMTYAAAARLGGYAVNYRNDERTTAYWHDPKTGEALAYAEDCDDYYDPSYEWSPADNPVEAKQVRQKLMSLGWDVQIISRSGGERFDARVHVGNYSYELHDARIAAKLPDYMEIETQSEELATCLIALIAIGEMEEPKRT